MCAKIRADTDVSFSHSVVFALNHTKHSKHAGMFVFVVHRICDGMRACVVHHRVYLRMYEWMYKCAFVRVAISIRIDKRYIETTLAKQTCIYKMRFSCSHIARSEFDLESRLNFSRSYSISQLLVNIHRTKQQ